MLRIYVGEPPEQGYEILERFDENFNEIPVEKFKACSLQEDDFFSVGVTSDQGYRSAHEDAEFIALHDGNAFFAVCDGHVGVGSAQNTVRVFKEKAERDGLFSTKSRSEDMITKIPQLIKEMDAEFCKSYVSVLARSNEFFKIFNPYLKLDTVFLGFELYIYQGSREWHNDSEETRKDLLQRVIQCYPPEKFPDVVTHVEHYSLKELKEWLLDKATILKDELSKYRSGNTFVGAFVEAKGNVVLFNLGDSRAVVYDKNGKVKQATKDHKPDNEEETKRIEKAGGRVRSGRVEGNLALSRSLGDPAYKKISDQANKYTADLISSDTEVFSQQADGTPLTLEHEDFIILACDGLWDVMGSEEVGQFVVEQLKAGKNAESISGELVQQAFRLHSGDNVTVMVVTRKT